MQPKSAARWTYLAPALGLVLAATLSACHSVENTQNQQGSFSAAPSEVHPSAVSAPATPHVGTVGPTGETTATADSASSGSAAVAAVTTSWNRFFSRNTPSSDRVMLLQNGSQFASVLKALAASPLASAVTSKVDSVTVTSGSQAKVAYELSGLGASAVRSVAGTAVWQDGRWKVGDDVFCRLLRQAKSAGLSVPVSSACGSAG